MSLSTLLPGLAAVLLAVVPAEGAVRVVTSTTDLASIAREVGGGAVQVDSITRGGQDPHFVELLPSYMVQVRRADVYVKVGMDLDYWAQAIIDGSRNAKLLVVDASSAVPVARRLEVPARTDASMGDVHKYGNPHYWLDPENGKLIARAIADGLKKADPGHAGSYESNLQAFVKRLDAKIADWRRRAAPLRGMRIVTYHNSWPYLARAFGLEVVDFLEPKPGVKPSPSHVNRLIRTIKDRGVVVIAHEPYFEKRTPELISRQTGIPRVVLPPSVGGVPEVRDYVALFEHDLDVLLRYAKR